MDLVIALSVFGLLALSSKTIGKIFSRVHMPQITGFLFTGILAGPYILEIVTEEATQKLVFLDEIALGFIAFAAGSELLLKELQGRLKSIRWVTVSLVSITFLLGSLTLFIISSYVPFMAEFNRNTRLAISLLAGAILVARSPSSAIAVVNELRARGPFTRTTLGVTVLIDVVVILLFAVNISVADALQTQASFSPVIIVVVLAEILVSIGLGYVLGKYLLPLLFRIPVPQDLQAMLFLGLGFAVFQFSAYLRHQSGEFIDHEILLEPLLICMSASFVLTNYTTYRAHLQKVLDAAGPSVYVLFFTLAGASLRINVLADTWTMALVLFGVRLFAIFLGGFAGGTIAGDPARFNRLAWMGYVTQAGIGLGLAKEVAVEFPAWGAEFATLIIAVIVLNQVVGPPLFKWVLHLVDEAHVGAGRKDLAGTPMAIIFGLDAQSTALARQLDQHGWKVKIASRQANEISPVPQSSAQVVPISAITLEELQRIEADSATAIVCMIEDQSNLEICEIAFEHFGTRTLIAQIQDREKIDLFRELNVLIVNPETALVGLLDHFVRSPSATSMLLGLDEDQDFEDFEVRNPDIHGLALRDLRLPLDTLVLSVSRRGAALVSHGYTTLHLGDIVTVVGSPKSLLEVNLKLTG